MRKGEGFARFKLVHPSDCAFTFLPALLAFFHADSTEFFCRMEGPHDTHCNAHDFVGHTSSLLELHGALAASGAVHRRRQHRPLPHQPLALLIAVHLLFKR
jgi:hypothetical protein